MVYPDNGIVLSTKKKKMSYHTMKRHEGKMYILLSEGSQTEQCTYCIIPNVWHCRKGKGMDTVKYQ